MEQKLRRQDISAVLIAGPTASGKSALALELARDLGGEIVNADSMQVYSVLDRLTARPGAGDLEAVPHHLYGHVSPVSAYSTGIWLDQATEAIAAIRARGALPVVVGGTGLYFRALTGGLSGHAGDTGADPHGIARSAWRRKASRRCIRNSPGWIRTWRRACVPPTASAFCARSRWFAPPASRLPRFRAAAVRRSSIR